MLGKVRAFTPLLDKPLEGPIYFRSNGGERGLPDAVADLNGQVHWSRSALEPATTRAQKNRGSGPRRHRPRCPVSKVVIELKGGKKHGVLVNSANICKSANRAMVKMCGQNGKGHDFNPEIGTSCGKK